MVVLHRERDPLTEIINDAPSFLLGELFPLRLPAQPCKPCSSLAKQSLVHLRGLQVLFRRLPGYVTGNVESVVISVEDH